MTYEITIEQLNTLRAALLAAEDELEEGSDWNKRLHQKRLELVWDGIAIIEHAPLVGTIPEQVSRD